MLPMLLMMVPHTLTHIHTLAHPLVQIRHTSEKMKEYKWKTFDDDNGNELPKWPRGQGSAGKQLHSCKCCMKITI